MDSLPTSALKWASRARQNSTISASLVRPPPPPPPPPSSQRCPSRSVTKAHGVSPQCGCGLATTLAYRKAPGEVQERSGKGPGAASPRRSPRAPPGAGTARPRPVHEVPRDSIESELMRRHRTALDLDCRDVLAARDDDVLGAVLDLEVPRRVDHREVAYRKAPGKVQERSRKGTGKSGPPRGRPCGTSHSRAPPPSRPRPRGT